MAGNTLIDPTHLEKVLVCTDESPDSQGAVNVGLALARTSGCRLYLLEVFEFLPDYEFPRETIIPPQLPYDLIAYREEAARTRLEAVKAEAAQQGLALEVRVRSSLAVYAGILEEVEELKPSLLVMGRRGRTGLERLLLGSVTARVIGHSPVSVLVVPREASLDFSRVLVANDGSPHGVAAWEQALLIAQKLGSTLMLASVCQSDRDLKAAEDIVESLEPVAEREKVALEPYVLEGRPYEAIVRLAQQKQATLIVLGSHGRTGLKRLLMGSVAERVLGQASCPVLVVKKR
jgi:hypothetical protein